MGNTNSFSHLTLAERQIILVGIRNGSSKTAIAKTIGKDKSTIGKEIALHRVLSHKCHLPLECAIYRNCPSAGNVRQTARPSSPFNAPAGTVPPERATVAPTGRAAASTSTPTTRKWLTESITVPLWIPDRVST